MLAIWWGLKLNRSVNEAVRGERIYEDLARLATAGTWKRADKGLNWE